MHDPLDLIITRLSAVRTPDALDDIEIAVFATIARTAHDVRGTRRAMAWSIGGALALGLVGGGLSAGQIDRAQPTAPIGIDAGLAPSTLLLGR